MTEYADRHGGKRYRFRKTGWPTYHFKNKPGTDEFAIEYRDALNAGGSGIAATNAPAPYSMDDLAARLYRSPAWLRTAASTQKTYRGVIDRYLDTKNARGRRYGTYPVKQVTLGGLEAHLAAYNDRPGAAATLRKALKKLFKYAQRLGWIKTNPAADTDPIPTKSKGWHTWTDEEIARFRSYWQLGTMARLTFELAMNTAARRINLAALERDHLVNGRWQIAHVKGNDETSVAITTEARAALDAMPAAPIRHLITGAHGKPYSVEGLSNRFRKWAREADCPTNIHGIRKGVSRILAESGATPLEGRAITGHKTDRTFAHYAAAADRARLADSAQARLIGEPLLANPEKD